MIVDTTPGDYLHMRALRRLITAIAIELGR